MPRALQTSGRLPDDVAPPTDRLMRPSTGLTAGSTRPGDARRTGSRIETRAMNVIEVSNLVKRYGDHTAVDGVSFSVEEGEIFAILGPNGAGKTTTVESISGLRTPDSGTIRVLGLDPRQRPRRASSRRRRPAPGERAAGSDPGRGGARSLRLVLRGAARPASGCSRTSGSPTSATPQFGKLSGGEKQRLSIALALIGNPKIAILDELTTGLDPQARRDTWQLIEDVRAGGVTVILVTHFMEEAERLADRIALIDEGRVVALDTPAGIVSRVDAEQRLRFRPSGPIDDGLLTGLPGVRSGDARWLDRRRRGHRQPRPGGHGRPGSPPDRRQRPADRSGRSRRRVRRPDRPQARKLDSQEIPDAHQDRGRRGQAVLPRARRVAPHDPAADDRPRRRRAACSGPSPTRPSAGGAGSTSSRRRWSS